MLLKQQDGFKIIPDLTIEEQTCTWEVARQTLREFFCSSDILVREALRRSCQNLCPSAPLAVISVQVSNKDTGQRFTAVLSTFLTVFVLNYSTVRFFYDSLCVYAFS